MKRHWLIGGAAAWMIAGIVFAKPGAVVTSDGTKYEGEVVEKNDQVVITIHGVETIIPREKITSVSYTEGFTKEFADRLAKLGQTDVAGRIALAHWAFDQRQYGKAHEALDSALLIDPNNREANDFQNTISSQLRLEENKVASNIPTPPPSANGIERRLLTAADINIIREKELQTGDNRATPRFENGVEKRFIQYANMQFSQFNALKPVDKALAILERGDDSMKQDVKILKDTNSIAEFRSTIQPMILNGCAASNCHGGPKGGALILYNPADNDQATYTNFYIMTQYKKAAPEGEAGLFTAKHRWLIDRGHGAASLLAQYALPTSVAEQDHPPVAGYDGIFRGRDEVRYRQVISWMDHSLKQVSPDYGIKFDPPKPPVPQPSTRPAP